MKFRYNSFYILYIILFLLLILGIFFDKEIALRSVHFRMNILNEFLIWVSYIGTWFVVLIVMTSLFLWNERKRKWIIPLWASVLISMGIVHLLKFLIARERPYIALGFEVLLEGNGHSFPSGHATAVFSTLGVLDREFPKLKWFWLGFAALVAFSRIYLGVHYLSDIAFGGIIGLSIGLIVVRFWKKSKKYFS